MDLLVLGLFGLPSGGCFCSRVLIPLHGFPCIGGEGDCDALPCSNSSLSSLKPQVLTFGFGSEKSDNVCRTISEKKGFKD